ncbi:unnamed protein product [Caenorhabditis angaria]|uniref:Uncharacterized protein n=1 Tax=Caenorhabditis angaria TaxID=860376 RepID=A0A9P1J6I5_9PELO|nr:unnamed protein product [Caenorhabditis angaria]
MLFKTTVILLVSCFFTQIFAFRDELAEKEITSIIQDLKKGLEQRTNSHYEVLLENTAIYILENPDIKLICQAEAARETPPPPLSLSKHARVQILLAFYEPDARLLRGLKDQIDVKLQKAIENQESLQTIAKLILHKDVLETAQHLADFKRFLKFLQAGIRDVSPLSKSSGF